jgi:hypothetical protein
MVGTSNSFKVSINDRNKGTVLFRTFGGLNSYTTIHYVQSGLRTFVNAIPNIVLGTMSNEVPVTIEQIVPYEIYLTPNVDE